MALSAKLRQRQLTCTCSATVQKASTSTGLPVRPSSTSRRPTSDLFRSFDVSTLPAPPPPSPTPEAMPIIHSTAYLELTRQLVVHKLPRPEPFPVRPSSSVDENMLQWALRKADASLDAIEHNPPAVQKAIYDMSRSPAGEAASKGVQAAAKLTMSATMEAAKVAAPAGKWALRQGFRAAVGLVSKAMEQEKQAPAAKRQEDKQRQRRG